MLDLFSMRNFYILLILAVLYTSFACADEGISSVFGDEKPIRYVYRDSIIGADDTIRLICDVFDDDWLLASLIDAAGRGREVRIILDGDFADSARGDAVIEDFTANGCEVAVEHTPDRLQSRFAIIDESTVIVSSYPFTNESALSPFIDALVVSDENIVEKYIIYFENCWELSELER